MASCGALGIASLCVVTCLAGCAGATKTPHGSSAPAHDEGATLVNRAAILRAEDRRVSDDALRAALADPDDHVRAMAVRAVGRIAAPDAMEALAAAIRDTVPSVREEAAFGLGQIGVPEGLAPLVGAARDGSVGVRTAVAEALGKIHDPAGAETLSVLLGDADPGVQAKACLAAWKFADPSFALEALIRASGADDPALVFAGAYALARLSASGAEPPSSGPEPGRLTDEGGARVRQRLEKLASSRFAEVRMQAARGLARPRNASEARALEILMKDPESGVQIAAIRSACLPGATIDSALRGELASKDSSVVYAVVEGLGRIGNASASDLLIETIIEDKRSWLKEAAITAFGKANPDLAAGAANGLSKEADPLLRAAAARNLAGRTDPLSEEIVKRLQRDPDARVQAAAALSRGGVEAPLRATMGDLPSSTDPAVREAVATVAGLRLARTNATPEERDEAFAMLERLWSGSAADSLPIARDAILAAAARAGKDPRAHAILVRALDDRDRVVRLRAIDLLRIGFGEDASAKAGPASERPLEEYEEVLRWASAPRAAIVTIQREGFDPGRFTVALDTSTAPLASWNFYHLAERGFFDGLLVHRVVPNFVVQDGDPRGDGNGDAGYSIRDEIGEAPFLAGTVGMASDGRDTAGSQWFVTLSAQPHLDGRYTAFGRVVQNLAGVVQRILPGDRVVSIRPYEGSGAEPLPALR